MIGWRGRGESKYVERSLNLLISLCILLSFFLGEGLNHDKVWKESIQYLFDNWGKVKGE